MSRTPQEGRARAALIRKAIVEMVSSDKERVYAPEEFRNMMINDGLEDVTAKEVRKQLASLVTKKLIIEEEHGAHEVVYGAPNTAATTSDDAIVRAARLRAVIIAYLNTNSDYVFTAERISRDLKTDIDDTQAALSKLHYHVMIAKTEKQGEVVYAAVSGNASKGNAKVPPQETLHVWGAALEQAILHLMKRIPGQLYSVPAIHAVLLRTNRWQRLPVNYVTDALEALLANKKIDVRHCDVGTYYWLPESKIAISDKQSVAAVMNAAPTPSEHISINMVKSTGRVRIEISGMVIDIGVVEL